MGKANPLVSVNILSYNRKDELRNTLQKVYSQNYKIIEVIVVDNNSSDNSAEMVELEFPSAKLIKLKENIGIAGWNEGFKIAKGEYVLVLDDDSYPEENAIEEGISAFDQWETLGIVAFNIFNNRIKKSETIGIENPALLFVGCGALIKKSVIEKVGYFNDSYFLYYHELEYSARCYDNDFEIVYLKNSKIIHEQSLTSRNSNENPFLSSRRFYYHFFNYSVFLAQNFYWRFAFLYLLKWFANRTIVCFKSGFYSSYLKVLIKLFKESKKILSKRNILNDEVQKFYKYGNIPLIDREFFPNFKKPRLDFLLPLLRR